MSDRPIEELTFEEAMRALEQVVERMESSELSLDETLALFERGMRLAQRCETLLDQAELRVAELTELLKGGTESLS